MQESLVNNIPEQTKNKISKDLPCHQTALLFSLCRIYISSFIQDDMSYGSFKEIGVGGILTLTLDRKKNTLYLEVYEFYRNIKIFSIEIYKNLTESSGYKVLKDTFHCIQFPFGHLGLSFVSKIQAEKLKNNIFFYSKVYKSIGSKPLFINSYNKHVNTSLFYEKEINELFVAVLTDLDVKYNA